MERMKVINFTTASSNDNSTPVIKESTVPLINSDIESRPTLPSLTDIIFGPYYHDFLNDQLEERNSQLQQYNGKLQHISMMFLEQCFQLDQLKNQLRQQDAQLQRRDAQLQRRDAQLQQRDAQLQQRDYQLQQKCQKCFSDDCKPICSKAPYHILEENLMVGNHIRE